MVPRILSRYGIVVGFIALCVYLSFASPYFLDLENVGNILSQVSINGIMAVGMTFVILSGGIDSALTATIAATAPARTEIAAAAANLQPGRRPRPLAEETGPCRGPSV